MGHGTGLVPLLYILSAPLHPLSELIHCSFLGSMLSGSVVLQGIFGNIVGTFACQTSGVATGMQEIEGGDIAKPSTLYRTGAPPQQRVIQPQTS